MAPTDISMDVNGITNMFNRCYFLSFLARITDAGKLLDCLMSYWALETRQSCSSQRFLDARLMLTSMCENLFMSVGVFQENQWCVNAKKSALESGFCKSFMR